VNECGYIYVARIAPVRYVLGCDWDNGSAEMGKEKKYESYEKGVRQGSDKMKDAELMSYLEALKERVKRIEEKLGLETMGLEK
jgi:hypothetical protein